MKLEDIQKIPSGSRVVLKHLHNTMSKAQVFYLGKSYDDRALITFTKSDGEIVKRWIHIGRIIKYVDPETNELIEPGSKYPLRGLSRL